MRSAAFVLIFAAANAIPGCDENRLIRLESRVQATETAIQAIKSRTSYAGSFSGCLLDTMRSANGSGAAVAAAIEQSCMTVASAPLPSEAIDAMSHSSTAQYGQLPSHAGSAKSGLYVTLQNSSQYTVTELTVFVTDGDGKQRTLITRTFDLPFALGAPTDPSDRFRAPPGVKYFVIPDVLAPKEVRSWGILSAKGYLQ